MISRYPGLTSITKVGDCKIEIYDDLSKSDKNTPHIKDIRFLRPAADVGSIELCCFAEISTTRYTNLHRLNIVTTKTYCFADNALEHFTTVSRERLVKELLNSSPHIAEWCLFHWDEI